MLHLAKWFLSEWWIFVWIILIIYWIEQVFADFVCRSFCYWSVICFAFPFSEQNPEVVPVWAFKIQFICCFPLLTCGILLYVHFGKHGIVPLCDICVRFDFLSLELLRMFICLRNSLQFLKVLLVYVEYPLVKDKQSCFALWYVEYYSELRLGIISCFNYRKEMSRKIPCFN